MGPLVRAVRCSGRLGSCRPESLGHCSLSFLHGIVLPNVGVGIWQWRSELAQGIGPIFPSTSKKVFIFLIIVGWGQSLVFHGVHLITWVVLSCLNMCVPCMDVIFTSTLTTSTRSLHLKKPCKKLHSG